MHRSPSELKILKAKTWLILNEPFFGALLLRLNYIEDNRPGATAWVDGINLGYGPEFINSISQEETRGLLAHEIMHCVLKHPLRRKQREPGKWNKACDYNINPDLLDFGFKLPNGGLLDRQYQGLSVDKIYTLLPEEQGNSKPEAGEVRDSPVSPSQQQEEDQKWTIAIQRAANQAQARGNLPDALKTLVSSVVKPKVPWKEMLRNFMSRPLKNDYSWLRINRRHIGEGICLPSNYSEGLGEVVIALDISGSITIQEITQFESEINSILDDTQPEKIYILYCDTNVKQDMIGEFTPDDLPIKLTHYKGGGTDFTEPFNWVLNNNITPDVFVYLTDLYGSCSAEEPDYPVMWVSTGKQTGIPFGEITELKI